MYGTFNSSVTGPGGAQQAPHLAFPPPPKSYSTTRSRRTRSCEDPLKLTYLTKRKQTGDRTFTVASSTEWNKLPLTLRQSPSIESFKKSLKTHLF